MSRGRAALMTLMLATGACSGASLVTTTAEPPADLTVTMNEWRFAPSDPSVPSGSPVILELRNSGSVLHEWAVTAGRVETESDLAGVEIIARLQVNAGGVGRLQVPALEPGLYQVICPIPGHIANGMVGTLTAEP